MNSLPPALNDLIEAFGLLPGVGPRSAERYAYNLLKRDPRAAKQLAASLDKLHDQITTCKVTFALIPAGQEYSELYTDPRRDKQLVAVVAEPLDITAQDVVTFGDMPNDVPMLRWAGLGVAMGNAHPEAIEAADEVTAPNTDDGLARVLERWWL